MNSDWNVGGVFFHSALTSALVALVLHILLRRILARTRVYAWLWHSSLADVAIFVVLWAGLVAALPV